MTDSLNLLKGTVDVLILRALEGEARHGYGVAEWIERVTDGTLLLEEGTLYPALHRLQRKRLVEGEWGVSDNNRRAKFYRLTDAGRKRLAQDTADWARYAGAVGRALGVEGGGRST
ncbi:MAG: PadR family transcriptional regulator [Longimicrobiales bacterium]